MKSTSIQNILLFVFKTVLPALLVLSCGSGGGGGDGEETPAPPTFPPAVFIADKTTVGVDELYAAFDDGTNIVKLSDTLVLEGDVVAFLVSPNGAYAAYVADQDIDEKFELYAVVVDKTADDTVVKVSSSGLLQLASGDYAFGWAPDSSRIAYIADQTSADVFELFTAKPDGTDNVRVSEALVGDEDVHFFQWEPATVSNLIAYAADQDTNDVVELYVSAADGSGGSVKVSGAMVGGSSGIKELPPTPSGRYAFDWASDSSRLAYVADQRTVDIFELFSSTPNGASNLRLSGPMGAAGDVNDFAWAPDNSKVAYLANQDVDVGVELYSAFPDGAGFLKNSNGIGVDSDVTEFKWAPDSSFIAYIANKTVTRFSLYTTSPNSAFSNVRVSSTNLLDSEVTSFSWASDSSRLAYISDDISLNVLELFTTTPAVPVVIRKISGDLVTDGDVLDFAWAPDGSRVAYRADQDTNDVFELYSSLPDVSVNDTVSGMLVSGGDVQEFKWFPDAILDPAVLGYLADQDTDEVIELFASLPNGDDNTKLSGTLVSGGNVASFDWVP